MVVWISSGTSFDSRHYSDAGAAAGLVARSSTSTQLFRPAVPLQNLCMALDRLVQTAAQL